MKTDDACSVGLMAWMVLGVLAVVGCGSAPIPAPTAYSSFNSKEGTFQCDYPDGWEAKGGGRRGPTWASFTQGSAEIRVTADITGSLLGDIGGGGASEGAPGTPPELQPVALIHNVGLSQAQDRDTSYREIGEPMIIDNNLGPSRYSEFSTSSAFGSSIHCYRATILAKDKRVVVYCTCAESDWTTLEPAFVKVIESFARGTPEL